MRNYVYEKKIRWNYRRIVLCFLCLLTSIIMVGCLVNPLEKKQDELCFFDIPDGYSLNWDTKIISSGDSLYGFAEEIKKEHSDTMSDISSRQLVWSICELNDLDYDTETGIWSSVKEGDKISLPYLKKLD